MQDPVGRIGREIGGTHKVSEEEGPSVRQHVNKPAKMGGSLLKVAKEEWFHILRAKGKTKCFSFCHEIGRDLRAACVGENSERIPEQRFVHPPGKRSGEALAASRIECRLRMERLDFAQDQPANGTSVWTYDMAGQIVV